MFQVLSIVQQTETSWALLVKKAVPWRNSLLHKFGNGLLYSFGIQSGISNTKISQILGVNLKKVYKIWKELHEFSANYNRTAAQKIQSDIFWSKRTLKFLIEIQAMIKNDHSKSVRSIVRDMWVFEFRIRHAWRYYKMRKCLFLSLNMKKRRKTALQSFRTNLSITTGRTYFGFSQMRNFLPGSDGKLIEHPLPCSILTRCTDWDKIKHPAHMIVFG